MKLRLDKEAKTGLYLGTEIEEKWWRRYMKDRLFARGNGRYWYDDRAFYFRRYLTKKPIVIPFASVSEIKVGKWHAGRWCSGHPVMKIVWIKDGVTLSSGFLVSKNKEEFSGLLAELRQRTL